MKMKNIILILFVISLINHFTSCSTPVKKNKTEIVVNESDIVRKQVGIKGMTCVGCEVTLEKQLSKIKGVVSVKASASDDNAIIEFDSTKTDFASIKHSIKEAGYKPVQESENK